MNDLISRQALCEYALNQKDKSVTPNDIMRFPSAQPEIVRCKDCKHWREGFAYMYCYKLYEMVLDTYDCMTSEDDYCSYAERRTDV